MREQESEEGGEREESVQGVSRDVVESTGHEGRGEKRREREAIREVESAALVARRLPAGVRLLAATLRALRSPRL
jgi:hypothetical protein